MSSFSALLLVGGQSKRMGQDKALLQDAASGLVLWQRQLRLLEELQPEEIFWSGPARQGIPAGLRIVEDVLPKIGPLGGIAAGLNVLCSDLLVVLAVDLPQMSAAFLKNLLTSCTPTCGLVAKSEGYFEPLAAIYPRTIQSLIQSHLEQERYALQDLLSEAERRGIIHSFQLGNADKSFFKNLNRPGDL